ncbi:hypothetical protein POL68_04835 [Stigmatella sp. ncwal1]|uniref:Lysozyme inhibitor LprI N-terminal domain-containing protein n=1 Tax=Stigmatella ashevillensis TaxID=2995309 RepID=A0ABT5D287_9BACT|nr:hypothetical protein [Stigmatella ashevillena]MDC0707787.1 hypothetical protein [Stigmatella ashevillena]
MSVSDPRKDPQYRPFRAATYGGYLILVTLFCLWLIVNVSRSVASMTPERLPAAEQVLSYGECLQSAQGLWAELETEREKLVRASEIAPRDVDQQWMRVRTGWLQKLRERESHCALNSRERSELRTVFRRMEEVQDLYTIHAVQYADEVGGAVDALQTAFAAARQKNGNHGP